MARYCFYCGRELGDSEKCYCRERTRAEATASSTPADSGSAYNQAAASAGTKAGTVSNENRRAGSQSTAYSRSDTAKAASHTSKTYSKYASKREEAQGRREAKKARRQADRERMKAARAEAKRRSEAQKAARRNAYGARSYKTTSNQYRAQSTAGYGRAFLRLFTAPADAIKEQAEPFWTSMHTVIFALTALLGGAHLSFANRWLYSLIPYNQTRPVKASGISLYLTGVLTTALFILIYTLIIWLLARFLYRQGGLPFSHTLAVGKTGWTYMALFMLLALPTTIQGGVFGLILVLMGFAFSALVQMRSLAVITHLNDNQTFNTMLISLVIFTSLASAVLAIFQSIIAF